MSRNNIIITVAVCVAVAALGAGGYWYQRSKPPASQPAAASATSSVQSAVDAAGVITERATRGTLPSMGDALNPLEHKPDLNPTDKANPFNAVKTNPFQ